MRRAGNWYWVLLIIALPISNSNIIRVKVTTAGLVEGADAHKLGAGIGPQKYL